MDINSLLSPSETPRSISPSAPNSPQPSPFKFVQRTQSGPLPSKHGVGASPLSQSVMNQSSIPAHVLSPASNQVSSPLISPVPATTHSQLARSTSTPSIDTLADLASMQGHGLKLTSAHIRNRDVYDQSKSPTILNTALAASLTSNPRASFDINMMEAPKKKPRTDFSSSSLSDEQQERLSRLAKHVEESPSAYESHVEIIKILHQGFVDHIYPPNDSSTRRDPHTYDLLHELRLARETMEKLFSIGEELWIDWLQDESILARSAEERTAVIETCRKAVDEEVGSISLWLAFGEWVRHCYSWAHDRSRDAESRIDEERLVGRELFTWDLVLETWREAVDKTNLSLTQSHVIWDKYLTIRIPEIQQKLAPDDVPTYMDLFERRLQTPHAMWEDTFQTFSSFVSANFDSAQYEQIMLEMSSLAADAKQKFSLREQLEAAVEQARKAQDPEAEYEAFVRYLEWEQTPEKRRKIDQELVIALFQRAELRFPTDSALWTDHVTFLLRHSQEDLLTVLERATKHCPWSGSLWSQYLLSSDRAGQSFHETEGIKHKATSTGLLEAAGIEEVVKVHGAWCSYLRRRSFRPEASEEDFDVAEMGIRSSIENVASLAAKLGLGDISDPAFRLHRIYIVFLSESGRWDNARQEFDNSVQEHGKSWEFWMLFYHWEMGRWRRFASNQQNTPDEQLANVSTPHLATAVLKKALDQTSLDYPEPIMQALMTHCEDFEDAEELQSAMLRVQKIQKAVAARRRIEALLAAESVNLPPTLSNEDSTASGTTKRKRLDEVTGGSNKKSKTEELAHDSVERSDPPHPKRDREHATVLVENLPGDVTETHLRQYFSNCGVVRSLKLLCDDENSAIVEFEDDEAAKYALSRNEQEFEGAILSVTLDTGSTLYLTNYKSSADERYIRNLLDKYGEIISVRFPSLQGNKRRRFCYVQFKMPSEAQAASAELDEKEIDNLILVCKISDPARRLVRKDNNANDGHTIFVGQLNFQATEDNLDSIFSEYGTIEKIRMPLHPVLKGRNKGIAYITYQSIAEATEAVSGMNGHLFQGRNLTVEVASNANPISRKRDSSARSATPVRNGEQPIITPVDSSSAYERQIFLTGVPDIVNEARMRSVAEGCGRIVRVVLKTNHQGAILEFSSASDAGQASLKLDGYEIAPKRFLRVVTETEMLSGSRERKVDGFQGSKEKPKPQPPASITGMAPVRRPQQPGARKRGHLGQRSFPLQQDSTGQGGKHNGDSIGGKKSNDDFRSMLNKAD